MNPGALESPSVCLSFCLLLEQASRGKQCEHVMNPQSFSCADVRPFDSCINV